MGIKYTAEGSRLENFSKPVKYTNPKILTGNWFEEKCAYKKNRYRHSSEYQNEFKPKPLTTYPKSIIWDAKFSSDFGNITGYGLMIEKKSEWHLDAPDPRMTNVTSHKCDFAAPDDNSYKFTRWTLPTPVRGKYGQYFRPFPIDHPRTDKYDPIKTACVKQCDEKCACMEVKFSQ
ncbi:unnamed protein product [Acanthoscelides obtectus]|uniref:Uncharacterized protein n=1 Tax=Acanthoscelides obtectus TaxID=200917 RepID=A0A9P0LH20_ACAOB|nr:unnamed protein product [Acanthoscelides obtectus]CAK1620806.1 hypothetical protein AOBTE_LOCUS578 [Acanthoscelides obtectus]